MSEMAVFLITLACIFGGTLLGMVLRSLLPEHHLSEVSKDVMKLGIGMVATMAALLLALLVASAKGSFDTLRGGLRQTGTKIVLLDRAMARYGPETREARDILRLIVSDAIGRIWPAEKKDIALETVGRSAIGIGDLEEKIRRLSPRNGDQRGHQSQALQITGEIREEMWQLTEQVGERSIPTLCLVLLISWLTIIFFTFGLFTSPNTTVIVVLFVCALSIASSLFLIVELDRPYGGMIRISSAPLLSALARLGQ